MDSSFLLYLAVAVGFYSAWSIGANDVANSMGTVVGSRALSIKKAIILAGIFEFCGAFFVGSHVTDTVRKGIIDVGLFTNTPEMLAFGMFAALLSTAMFLHAATFYGMPVSTTHSIVGSIFGFGLITTGVGSVHWGTIFSIAASWVLSPLFGGILAFLLFILIRKLVLSRDKPFAAIIKTAPYLTFALFTTLMLAIFYKGLKNLNLDLPFFTALLYASCIGLVAAFITRAALLRWNRKLPKAATLEIEYANTEKVFGVLQLFTCSYIAFAHGANDVANAIGPLAAVVSIIKSGSVQMQVQVPLWILGLGGVGIVIGLATYGYRVMATIGKKITEITPSRGFCAEFSAATTVLVCSKMGMPVSTTHTIVGAVIGVGFARGISTLDTKVITRIFTSWLLTIPIAAAITILIYKILIAIFM